MSLFTILILFLLINNIILNIFPLPNYITYWDEIVELIVIIYGLLRLRNNKIQKKFFINYLLLAIVVIIGLLGNFVFKFSYSNEAIFKDIFNFLKFPLTLLILISFNIDNQTKKEKYLKTYNSILKFTKFLIIVIFTFSIISLFFNIGMSQNEIRNGIAPYKFLFSHSTYLVLNCVLMLAIIESDSNKKNLSLFRIMITIIIITTMRTKGIAFISIYLFITYFGKYFKKVKLLYIITALLIIVTVSYSKLKLYISFASSPREVLYFGSLKLLQYCFPFGSGFGTFASHISAKYFSNAYNFINLPKYYLQNKDFLVVLGDAGYPYYIAQFGTFGLLLFSKFFINLYKLLSENIENKVPIIIIFVYIIIALTSETILLNSGIELAFITFLIYIVNNKYLKKE